MTPDRLAALDAALAGVLAANGTAATLAVGAADPVAVQIDPQEIPDRVLVARYGQNHGRGLRVTLRMAVLPEGQPQHGAALVIASGAHAGSWRFLGWEARDDVAAVLVFAMATRITPAAPAAREVRR